MLGFLSFNICVKLYVPCVCFVVAGQARIFGCLQENVAKSGFGESCRQQVEQRQEKMQDDYRLNYGVASQCGADVDAYCSFEKVICSTLVMLQIIISTS